MTEYQSTQRELSQFINIIWRRKWIIAGIMLLMVVPFVYINQTQEPVYEARTKLVYEINKSVLSEMSYSTVLLGSIKLSNLIEEIDSWTLMHDVAKSLPDSLIKSYAPMDLANDSSNYEDHLVHNLNQSVSAQTVPNSDILRISARGTHALAAQAVANKTAEMLIQRNLHSAMYEANTNRQTIKNQLDYLKQRVQETEQALKEFKEHENITNIEQESQELFRRITDAEIEYNRILATLNASNERYRYLKNKLDKERNNLVPSITSTTSPWIQQLKDRLVELEVQYTNLKVQNYSDRHPKLRALKEQIEKTKRNLKEESIKIAQGERPIDPLSEMQQNFVELTQLEVDIHTSQARKSALEQIIQSYNNQLVSMPSKELELGQLIRNKNVAANLYTTMLQKYEETKYTGAEQPGSLRIIDPARKPMKPISPRKKFNLIIGLFLGFIIGVISTLLIELFNQSIKSEDVIESEVGLPVFSSIPKIASLKKKGKRTQVHKKLITLNMPHSAGSESFKILRTNLYFSENESDIKTIAVTSSNEDEGKSFVAANLAIATAQMGHRTLLIDTDLRNPTLHQIFDLPRFPGLTHIFMKHKKRKSNRKEFLHLVTSRNQEDELMPFIHDTQIENLFVTTSGKIPKHPSELLATQTMKQCVQVLRKYFDTIIFDLPPVNIVTDPAIIAKESDAVILVVRADKSKIENISRAKNRMDRVLTDQVFGVVLNYMENIHSYQHSIKSKQDLKQTRLDKVSTSPMNNRKKYVNNS